MTQPGPSAVRIAGLALAAALVHLSSDWVALHIPGGVPPHLRIEYAPEVFRVIPRVALSITTSTVNGIIAAIVLVSLDAVRSPRAQSSSGARALVLGGILWGFWILADGLMALVWLSLPWRLAVGGLAAGLPRCLAVGYVLAALGSSETSPMPRRS